MDVFGIIGMTFGAIAFVYSLNAMGQVSRLEKKLREAGVLDRDSAPE